MALFLALILIMAILQVIPALSTALVLSMASIAECRLELDMAEGYTMRKKVQVAYGWAAVLHFSLDKIMRDARDDAREDLPINIRCGGG